MRACGVGIVYVCACLYVFAWVVSAHVSAPYSIAGSMHEL